MQITAHVNFHYNYQQCTITPKVNMTETTSQLSHGLLFNKLSDQSFFISVTALTHVIMFCHLFGCPTVIPLLLLPNQFLFLSTDFRWQDLISQDGGFFVFWLFCFVLFYSCNIFVNGTCQQTEEKSAFTSNLGEITMQMIKRGSNHE